jgi:hypothetical protein
MHVSSLSAEREIEILLYGALFHLVDVATTWIAMSLGAQETMIVARWFLRSYGPVGLLIQKTLVFIGAYLLWRGFRRYRSTIDHSWTIPIAFLFAGLLPAAWNTSNILIRILF